MATYKLNTATDTTWEINESGSIWILGKDGSITGTDIDGIATVGAYAAATVRINGGIDLDGSVSRGAYLESEIGAITVGETGHVSAAFVGLCYNNSLGTVTIDNAGLLQAQYGIAASVKQGMTHIGNVGHIQASNFGIYETGAGAEIVNSGAIKADGGIRVSNGLSDENPLWADKATHIENSGKITGADNAIEAVGVAANIRNTGMLNGDVLLGDGDDVLDTRGGTINGAIYFGAGNDMLDGRKATINGAIFGELGDDVVTLASAAQVFVEEAAQGNDTVRINATYLLGENIENLTLLGKANHTGIGNVHANILTGNKGANTLFGLEGGDRLDGGRGNDTLMGGTAADVFVFKAGYGKDTIGDFEQGADHIDLTDFQFGNVNDIPIAKIGDNLVITLSDTDTLIIRDGAVNNVTLDAGDFYL
jgi:Ca2+-binding RTX toxin-like protein